MPTLETVEATGVASTVRLAQSSSALFSAFGEVTGWPVPPALAAPFELELLLELPALFEFELPPAFTSLLALKPPPDPALPFEVELLPVFALPAEFASPFELSPPTDFDLSLEPEFPPVLASLAELSLPLEPGLRSELSADFTLLLWLALALAL